MTVNCGDTWTSVSKLIRQRISADGYERWFHGVDVISDDGRKLVFRVPNPIHQFFIERNYLRLVQEAASVYGFTKNPLLRDTLTQHVRGQSAPSTAQR